MKYITYNMYIQYACVLSHFSHVRLCVTIWTAACQPPCPWDSPGKNTGVGCGAFLQVIFSTQGLNQHLLYLSELAGGFFTVNVTWEAPYI